MVIRELLPIGSVVLLEGGTKKIMIFGVRQSHVDQNKPAEDYDYIGVMYPEGNMGPEYQFLFNHEDIKTVVFRGYEDEERAEFIRKLEAFYK